MSYATIGAMQASAALLSRITACAAREQIREPLLWAQRASWYVCAAPEWDDAWQYAANTITDQTDLGGNEAVITDAMILAAVQQVRSDHPDIEGVLV